MRLLFAIPVRIYQAFSSVSSPRCKYYPSCSNYAITAVRRYGVKGVGMAAWRLMRCNPWSHGGVDYVRPKTKAEAKTITEQSLQSMKAAT